MSALDRGPLERARHGVVAVADGQRCHVAIAPLWYDGAGVWALLPAPGYSERLRAGADAAVWAGAPPGEAGAFVVGSARVFGVHDPVGLLTHAATVSAAVAALGATNPQALGELLEEAARLPPRLPAQRVVARVALARVRGLEVPSAGPGVAPALPVGVPGDVRRTLSGERQVVLAYVQDGRPLLLPAVWGGGFQLEAMAPLPAPGTYVTALAVAADRAGQVTALALSGVLRERQVLQPERALWWYGFRSGGEAELVAQAGIELPE